MASPLRYRIVDVVTGAHALVPLRAIDQATLPARVFAPAVSVVEDSGSGSAAGPIGPLARQVWGTHADVTILMGAEMGRPCELHVQTAGEIRLGGRIALSAEGRFLV
jgi:predicted PhzF superfamily epimerase YddE/YHI9